MLKPLLLALSVLVFAVVKFNKNKKPKISQKNFKKSVDKPKSL